MTAPDTPPRHPRAALLLAHALDDVTRARWREGWDAPHDARLVLTAPHRAPAGALGPPTPLEVPPW